MRSLWRDALVAGLFAAGAGCAGAPEPVPVRLGDLHLVADHDVVEARVPPRATLAGLLRQHAVSDGLVAAIVERVRPVLNPRHLRADQPYRLVKDLDGRLRRFEYEIDTERFLRVSLSKGAATLGSGSEPAPQLEVAIVPYERSRALLAVRGEIGESRPSLIEALEATGERVELAIALATIFAGEVDFNHDVQVGDRFEVLFEKRLLDERVAGYGPILAASFTNAGRRVQAFRYDVPGTGPGYYDEHGRSLKRFMLSSPLPYEPRVTSRFSRRRLHPILGDYRAHLGVDYAAPAGTPVVAVASGVVVAAGWSGGSGRTVHLRHASGYETFYLHLSAIAPGVRPGARVAQGQVIGRVGATGLATGPHLDFRLRRHGVFVNPLLERRRMPPGEPVPPAYRADFEAVRDRARFWLSDGAPSAVTDEAARATGRL